MNKCAKCGSVLNLGDVFCSECGTKYVEPIQEESTKAELQNKELSVDERGVNIEAVTPMFERKRERVCESCNNPIEDGGGYCMNCGKQYSADGVDKSEKSEKKLFVVGLIVAIIVLVGFVISVVGLCISVHKKQEQQIEIEALEESIEELSDIINSY